MGPRDGRDPMRDIANERHRHENALKLFQLKISYQFFWFLVALIFTSLSLSIQFQISTVSIYCKICEVISWGLLTVSGILSLVLLRKFGLPVISCNILETTYNFPLQIWPA